MIILDTSVLVYAVGEPHPLRDPCRGLLAAHANEILEASTTIEVIQEFIHVRSQRRPRADAAAIARGYISAFNLATAEPADLELGIDLYERLPRLGAFDAVLAAVALNRRAQGLVSADRAFGDVPNLTWIDPADSALEGIVFPNGH